jgi:hypothetical protein
MIEILVFNLGIVLIITSLLNSKELQRILSILFWLKVFVENKLCN